MVLILMSCCSKLTFLIEISQRGCEFCPGVGTKGRLHEKKSSCSFGFLLDILGIFWAYFGYILDISWAYFGYILDISWAYLRHILGIFWLLSWAYLGHILVFATIGCQDGLSRLLSRLKLFHCLAHLVWQFLAFFRCLSKLIHRFV